LCRKLGRGKISLSKKIKDSVKSAVKFIDDFEVTAAEIAVENAYDFVACGHIHQPQHRRVDTDKGSVIYLNSGDWIENLTALEYTDGQWQLYKYMEDEVARAVALPSRAERKKNMEYAFDALVHEFLSVKA
jgi:UDP-2,3-diacylglucosamine pyrophosphatase LpxH